MDIHAFDGRILGCLTCSVFLFMVAEPAFVAGASASSNPPEVAVEYKARRQVDFLLADYRDELLECSALAAIHMWIGDNIGDDSGAEVRQALTSDYWVGVSRNYLLLAEEASGGSDLGKELGVRMRALGAEWRRLNEAGAGANVWGGWYELIDRCDTWRPERPAHSFFNNGRDGDASDTPAKVAMNSE